MLTLRAVLIRINAGTKWIVSGEELPLNVSAGAAVGKGEGLKYPEHTQYVHADHTDDRFQTSRQASNSQRATLSQSRGRLGGAPVASPRHHLLGSAGIGACGRQLQAVEDTWSPSFHPARTSSEASTVMTCSAWGIG